jgi:hypothetical protein
MRLSVTRLIGFPSACRHLAGLGPLASHYSELFGTGFNTALDLADIELPGCRRGLGGLPPVFVGRDGELRQPGPFSEPCALRALGVARDDRALLRQALTRFEAMGLSWHAEQTRGLL